MGCHIHRRGGHSRKYHRYFFTVRWKPYVYRECDHYLAPPEISGIPGQGAVEMPGLIVEAERTSTTTIFATAFRDTFAGATPMLGGFATIKDGPTGTFQRWHLTCCRLRYRLVRRSPLE